MPIGRLLCLWACALVGGLGWTGSVDAQDEWLRVNQVPINQRTAAGVHAIAQDDVGYLWFGTQNGLYAYDGYAFTTYRADPNDETSLSHDYVRCLLHDAAGSLWIGTEAGGLNHWQRETDRFTAYRHDPQDPTSLPSDQVRALLRDRSGLLWIGTHRGLVRFDPADGAMTRIPNRIGGDAGDPSSDAILSLLQDRRGRIWVGTRSGLGRLAARDRTIELIAHVAAASGTEPDAATVRQIPALLEDRHGDLWIGTDQGLLRMRAGTDTFERLQDDTHVPALHQAHVRSLVQRENEDDIWVATQQGLFRVDPTTEVIGRYAAAPDRDDGLPVDSLLTLQRGRDDSIWIGSLGASAQHWDPTVQLFPYVSQIDLDDRSTIRLDETFALAFAQPTPNIIWIGTLGAGLVRWDRSQDGDRSTRVFRHDPDDPTSLSDDRITSLLHGRDGTLWIGTLRGGLNRIAASDADDGGTPRFVQHRSDPSRDDRLQSNGISHLLEDRNGTVWIGTVGGGLSRWHPETESFITYRHQGGDPAVGLSSDRIAALAEDTRGWLWIATRNDGLNALDPSTGQILTFRERPGKTDSLSNNTLRSLHVDRDGQLWIGHKGSGLSKLMRFEPSRGHAAFARFGVNDGLPGSVVYGIQSDLRTGDLWLATNAGLSRRAPAHSTYRNYGPEHGLQGIDFNEGAHHRSPDGTLFFGGVNGFNVFDPGAIALERAPPPLVLTRFTIDDRPVQLDPTLRALAAPLTLDHTVNGFSATFAALDFTAPERTRYTYRLDGFESDWRALGPLRIATYTNLDPGNYTLEVRARNGDGVWSDPPLVLPITVVPAPWQTWWAYTAYALLGAVLLAGSVRLRLRQLRRYSARLEGQVRARTAQLSDAVERLRISPQQAPDARNRAVEAQEEAEVQRKKAMAANRAKTSFLSNMSHELRTPLNAVIGFSQIMARDDNLPGRHRTHLETVLRSGEHLLGLINDVLSLSKIEAGKTTFDARPFDLTRLLDDIAMISRSRIDHPDLALRVESDPALPRAVRGDAGKLRQVLINLINNAIKFTQKGRVTLRAQTDEADDQVRFAVGDTGVGMTPAELAALFKPFVQTQSGREAREGTGLGLSISRGFVRAMGGELQVESTVDVGTTFHFIVPLPEAPELPTAARRTRVRHLASDQTPPRVLVADDAPDSRNLLATLMGDVGCAVREAGDGDATLDVWRSWQPELIWLDMRMPKRDGFAVIDAIRAAEAEAESDDVGTPVVIIALTASALADDHEAIRRTRCNDLLAKPFDAEDTYALMAEHLGVRFVYDDAPADPGGAIRLATAPIAHEPARSAVRSDREVTQSGKLSLVPARLSLLPIDWLEALRRALDMGDDQAAEEVIINIERQDPTLARALRGTIRSYRIEGLLNALEEAVQS
ncbi:MAG: two-component regulator propeller domain-containing protein [Acidobacteriota bacterium]